MLANHTNIGPLAFLATCAWLCASAALAQHSPVEHQIHGATAPAGAAHGPYSGIHGRTISALSEQQLSDLRAGKGMSLALPAELNGYPGPSHTLELAEPLKLTAEQRSRTQALFEQMQREARTAGEDVIAAEMALDALFRAKAVTPGALRTATQNAALAQGKLREPHLRYHLAKVQLLSPEQVSAYTKLRGN